MEEDREQGEWKSECEVGGLLELIEEECGENRSFEDRVGDELGVD